MASVERRFSDDGGMPTRHSRTDTHLVSQRPTRPTQVQIDIIVARRRGSEHKVPPLIKKIFAYETY